MNSAAPPEEEQWICRTGSVNGTEIAACRGKAFDEPGGRPKENPRGQLLVVRGVKGVRGKSGNYFGSSFSAAELMQ